VIDPLIAGLAGHATAQLQILKDNLQNVAEYAEEMMSKMDGEVDDTVRDKIIYDRIKLSVEHHSEILRY
jgi:oligoribonuclease (3'-5' exoribonuclease)